MLAPAVIDPVPTQPDFTFNYGIRTAGPATVNIRSNGLHPAQVVTVAVPARESFAQYDFTLVSPVDYFAAGLFVGDNEALADMYLWNSDTFEFISTRAGHIPDPLLEAHDLPAGRCRSIVVRCCLGGFMCGQHTGRGMIVIRRCRA